MKKASIKKEYLTAEEILDTTNGGHDVFRHYLGSVSRIMRRPWPGSKDNKPSWGVFLYNGTWFWKDAANEESGTAITFVQKMFGLTFNEAKDKICWDFGLGGKEINTSPVIVNWQKPDTEKEYIHISFSSKPFEKKHLEFWHPIEESYCNKYECWAVKDLSINRRRIGIKKDEIVFAFYAPDEDGVKIYFPEREAEAKWRNNLPYHYLWNYKNVQECDKLVVQKSVKDMIVTSLLAPCVIATQAEAVKIFNEEVVGKINNISPNPWIWYGSDWDGVKKCKEITDTHKWKYINTPKSLLPEVNDAYGYMKKFGLDDLEKFMKLKKLI